MQDPRVFFAAERTLLAWLRTGAISILVATLQHCRFIATLLAAYLVGSAF